MANKRIWIPLLGMAAIAAALIATFAWPQRNGLDFNLDGSRRAQAADQQKPHDLTALAIIDPTLSYVRDSYVDPKRVDYKTMLLAGLNAIQRNVAPVLVEHKDGADTFKVRVRDKEKQFDAKGVQAPWDVSARFKEVFTFLQKHLKDEADLDLREVEYAAVNGMLHTLDPHTTLLTPNIFKEMRTSTRGEFGGLGIVISIRDGHLTVIRPIDGTPASKAGLKRNDRIVKINEESTLNMPLSEAVGRLRGKPGSKVNVWVARKLSSKTYTKPRKVGLTRAIIHIDSVEGRMLKDRVGYVKVNNFQGNTINDLVKVLRKFRKRNMQGLVLDLRGNPGGLFDQAVRVSDLFLTAGPIVTTSSQNPSQRDEKFARSSGTEPNYPIVVLINGGSASASEIVAGALKNHDRTLIIGQNSFGKGSVQMLYPLKGGSALKLTIAQYLTPGDVSIQGVGIVPDVAIAPMTVDKDDLDLKVDKVFLRESDLRSHLTHDRASDAQRPEMVLRYYLSSELRQRLAEAEPNEEENKDEENFLIEFSRKMVANAPRAGRLEMLRDAGKTLEQIRKKELGKAVAELKRLGVDWSEGKDEGPSTLKIQAGTDRADNSAKAGESFSLKVSATNMGKNPLYQVSALTESDNRLFNGRELVFGKIAPGETKTWSTTLGICSMKDNKRICRLPRGTSTRADVIKLNFEEAHGHAPAPVEVRTHVEELIAPEFAYSYQVTDNLSGNGDASVQPGERMTIYFRVKNVGKGTSEEAQANLRNLSGAGVLLQKARFTLKDIKPGEEELVPFTFEVLPDFEGETAKLKLAVIDTDLRVFATEKFDVPIAKTAEKITRIKRPITLKNKAVLRAQPDASSMSIAVADGPHTLRASAALKGFYKVDLGEGRGAWVAQSDVTEGKKAAGKLVYTFGKQSPRIDVQIPNERVTRDDRIIIEGNARDESRIRDMYIFAGNRKVFYKSNEGDPTSISFKATVPLHGGMNYISVIVRETEDTLSRETFIIRRDAKDGSAMKTPKYDDELLSDLGPAH